MPVTRGCVGRHGVKTCLQGGEGGANQPRIGRRTNTIVRPSADQAGLRGHELQVDLVAMTAKLNGFRAVPDGMIRIQGLEMAK